MEGRQNNFLEFLKMQDIRGSHLPGEEVDIVNPPAKKVKKSSPRDEKAMAEMRKSFDEKSYDNFFQEKTPVKPPKQEEELKKPSHFKIEAPKKDHFAENDQKKMEFVAKSTTKCESTFWSAFANPDFLDQLSDVIVILTRVDPQSPSRSHGVRFKGIDDAENKSQELQTKGKVAWINKAAQTHFGVWPKSLNGLSFLPFLFDESDTVSFSSSVSNCFNSQTQTNASSFLLKDVAMNVALASGKKGFAKVDFTLHSVESSNGPQDAIICIMKIVEEEEKSLTPVFDPYETVKKKVYTNESFLKCLERSLTNETATEELLHNFFEDAPLAIGILEAIPHENDIEIVWSNFSLSQLIHLTTAQIIHSKMKRDLKLINVEEWLEALSHVATNLKQILFELSFGEQSKLSCTFKRISENRYLFIGCLSASKTVERIMEKNQATISEAAALHRNSQLNDALQVKSRFLAVMSHEIRTPLAGILGTLELISQTNLTTSQKELIQTSHLCGEQLLLVLSDILDFSQMAENKLSLDLVPFSVPNLLEEAVEVVSFESSKKGLEIICDVDPHTENRCIGDVRRIRQILVNLLSNAVKFSSQGEIVVGIKSIQMGNKQCELQLFVRDQGIGILEEIKPFIFQPFMQADNSCTRKVGGSGLGLCISEQLCKMMGGKMWFKSAIGQGSTFFFNVILSKSPETAESMKESIDFGLKRILLVDSSTSHSKAMSNKLTSLGFYVRIVETIKHAHSLVSSQPDTFHVVLVGPNQDEAMIKQLHLICPLILMGCEIHGIDSIKKPVKDRDLKEALATQLGDDKRFQKMIPAKKKQVSLPPLSILVAEDTLSNQMIIRKLLETLGFKDVVIVNNGKKALDLAKVRTFDVILMDVMMPEMGGIEATERIRAEVPASCQPCIIALTANAFEADKRECLASGMSSVVTKPIDRNALVEALANSLEWKRAFQDEAMRSLNKEHQIK